MKRTEGNSDNSRPILGVVIVTFNSTEVILECLDSLFAAHGPQLRVVVVDNDSPDNTVATIRDCDTGKLRLSRRQDSPINGDSQAPIPINIEERGVDDKSSPRLALTIVQTGLNGGFAFAVNRGLEVLLADHHIDLFWILNPDCVVPSKTPLQLLETAVRGPFSMIGVRQLFYERPDIIQSDAFRLNRRTGVCISINSGKDAAIAIRPNEETIDFVSGASMVVSRQFIELAGLMHEGYFLYYEEADWAFRRGSLPVRLASEAIVYHHGGTSIGTGIYGRRATPFANYFNTRNRSWFARKYLPGKLPIVRLYALLKASQLLLRFAPAEAWALLAGALELAPPASVRNRIPDARVQALAFGERS